MPKHLPYAATLIALLLGSCDNRIRASAADAFDLADVAQVNARSALSQNEEQASKIEELERKVRALELRLSDVEAVNLEQARITNENARLLDERWDAYRSHTH